MVPQYFIVVPSKKKGTKPSNPGIFHMGAIFWTTHLIDFYWKTTSMRWWNFPGPPEFHWETQNPDVDVGLKMGNTNNSTGLSSSFHEKKNDMYIYYHILSYINMLTCLGQNRIFGHTHPMLCRWPLVGKTEGSVKGPRKWWLKCPNITQPFGNHQE